MPTDKERAERTIIDKINLVAAGITNGSKRDTDLMIAQTVQALAAAYKDLRNTPEIMEEEDTDTEGNICDEREAGNCPFYTARGDA